MIGDILNAFDKGKALLKAKAYPSFRKVMLGDMPPEAVATTRSIIEINASASDLRDSISLYRDDNAFNAWCHELRLRMWVVNEASNTMHITGILTNKTVLDLEYKSAVLYPPQGVAGGDVVRFACDLDSDAPSMKRFELRNNAKEYTSANYYFDEGALELDPGHMICISILFNARKAVYEIEPELVFEINGSTESIAVPLPRKAIVCPLSLIPEDERYVRTFRREPPFVAVKTFGEW